MKFFLKTGIFASILMAGISPSHADYNGLLYSSGNQDNPKYSGAFGTGFTTNRPQAIYDASSNKTFFTYSRNAGTAEAQSRLKSNGTLRDDGKGDIMRYMVGCYDHDLNNGAGGLCPEGPVEFSSRWIVDGHDNPAISLEAERDASGNKTGKNFLRLYVSGRNAFCHEYSPNTVTQVNVDAWYLAPRGQRQTRCSESYKSATTTDQWNLNGSLQTIWDDKNYSYVQPWETDEGQVLIHTRYSDTNDPNIKKSIRELWIRKANGQDYRLVRGGHYAVSYAKDNEIHIAYSSMYSRTGNAWTQADFRTNLYHIYSTDSGNTWHTSGCKNVTGISGCRTFSGTAKSQIRNGSGSWDDLHPRELSAKVIDVDGLSFKDSAGNDYEGQNNDNNYTTEDGSTRYSIFVQDIRFSEVSENRVNDPVNFPYAKHNIYVLYTQVRSTTAADCSQYPDGSTGFINCINRPSVDPEDDRSVKLLLLQHNNQQQSSANWRKWTVAKKGYSNRYVSHNYSNGFVDGKGTVFMPFSHWFGSLDNDRAGGAIAVYAYDGANNMYGRSQLMHHIGGRYNNCLTDVTYKTNSSAQDFSFFWGDAPLYTGKNYSTDSDLFYADSNNAVTKMVKP